MARKPTYEELEKSLKELRGEILKREHVEKELLVMRGRLQHLITSSPAVLYTSNPGGDYGATFISENVKGQIGYEPQEFVNDPMFWANHIHPEDRSRILDGLSQLFEKGFHSHEYRFQHNDGTYRWMRDELRLVLDGEGHPVEIVGYWIDIDDRKQAEQELQKAHNKLEERVKERTKKLSKANEELKVENIERKQAEDGLRESEAKYRQLSDSLPQIVFETDEKGNLTFTNRMAFDILGYTREDFEKGLNALQMLIPEDQDRALKNIQRVLKGEKLGGTEYTALTKDGRRYPAVVYSTPIISEGKSVGMRGIVADLTEVEQAQKALLESDERLRIAGKAAYDLIYEWDVASEALEWFGDVDGLLGYRKGEISRDINAWLDLINPEDRVTLENAVELHKTATESIQYEYRVRHKDGTYRHWNDHGLPLLDDKGCPYKWVGVCTDITERKRFEEALRESEKKYRTLLGTTLEGCWLLNREVKTIEVNAALCKMLGYSQDEMLGKTPFDFVDDKNRKIFIEQTSKISDTEHRSYEITLKKRNGEDLHT